MRKILLTLTAAAFALAGSAQTYIPVAFNQPPLLMANAGTDDVICHGEVANLGGNPAANGGTPVYSYSWTSSGPLNSSNVANPTANPTSNASYVLTVTDSRGCTSVDTIVITVDTCTNVDANAFPGEVSVFPNPNDGNFMVRLNGFDQPEEVTVRVMNTLGQIVTEKSLGTVSGQRDEAFSLPLSKGQYRVEIAAGNKKTVRSIIIR